MLDDFEPANKRIHVGGLITEGQSFLRLEPSNSGTQCFRSNSNMSSDASSSVGMVNLPPALQSTISGGPKRDKKMAKRFVREKLSKQVQFLQTNNDEMMNRVYKQARKYMKYRPDSFMTVWTKTVLPMIKSEMNVLRSGYAAAMKNRIIRGMYSVRCKNVQF